MTEPTADLPAPARVLAIGAHPDDVEINAGATLAKWRAAGTELHVGICTDGSKGTWDPAADPAQLVARRAQEQREALGALGGGHGHWFDAIDGELTDTLERRGAIAAVIRAVRPDVVITHDPWKRYRLHPDHEQAGRLVIGAIVAARDPHFFPEHEHAPWRPRHLLLFEAEEINHVEHIEGFVDHKASALLAHRSQWQSTFGIDPDRPDLDTFRTGITRQRSETFHRLDDL